MVHEGLKLTYTLGSIDGVRDAIKYEVGDFVWVYFISESYRHLHPDKRFMKRKGKIEKVQESSDGKHFEQYGIEFENGEYGSWFYPTFLEPFNS